MQTSKKAIIYNFVGGAGGDGLAAKNHNAPHTLTELGKVKLLKKSNTVMKELVWDRFDDFFDAIMSLPPNDFYVTHDLNLLNETQLELVYRDFDIISIDDSESHIETFLLNLLKNVIPQRAHEITLVLGGKKLYCKNEHSLSVLELWDEITGKDYPKDLRARFEMLLQEYCDGQGLFYEQHQSWHSKRYPGRYIKYKAKETLGTYKVRGITWNLDQYRAQAQGIAKR